jgi:hypothetical protein
MPRTLRSKTITVPGNLLQACDEFNAGLYYECHESLEEIWQEETGELRDLYKGLIQVAAAYVHITRSNVNGASRLLTTAIGYLDRYRPTAMGFDIEGISRDAERSLAHVRASVSGALAPDPGLTPYYTCDTWRLPSEARRWRAWGFDGQGEALEMTITVPE